MRHLDGVWSPRRGAHVSPGDVPGSAPGTIRSAVEAYAFGVSVAEHPREPGHLTVVSPKEALQRAQPLPSDDDMAIEGITDEEWDAFERALADR